MGGTPTLSVDLFVILAGVLRRWKLITAITLTTFIATYGILKLKPLLYKSTVEILVFGLGNADRYRRPAAATVDTPGIAGHVIT